MIFGALLCGVVGAGLGGCEPPASGRAAIATVEVVRTPVEITGPGGRHAIDSDERLGSGQRVAVAPQAQAILRHDQGARLLLDSDSEVEIDEAGVQLRSGRLWVDAKSGAQARVQVGDFTLVASSAGFEVTAAQPARVTVIRGEVTWQGLPRRGVVHAGEMLALGGAEAAPKPVVLWEDWTGGLGWPDPRKNRGAAGLGEVGARRPGDLGTARFPLSIHHLQVRTRIEDDLAVTTVEETFFNPADTTLEGIFRVRLPEGAILSRFAIDRRGRLVDGYVKERETAQRQYQQQVYEGSTHDPALLEWEAPGSYKARLYPLPPGASRRVLYSYSEWLPPHGDGNALRSFRYPMAGAAGEGAPLIQELDIEVDTRHAGAKEVRAGLGALLSKDGQRVVLQRTDYLPTADLVVELLGAPRPADVARVYHVPHQTPPRPGAGRPRAENDYVLIRAAPVPPPAAGAPTPVDLVLLVDVSAGTDATHLAMARTLVEAVLRRLGPQDRVVLLGADLEAHALSATAGKAPQPTPQFVAATPEQVAALLAQLGGSVTGGATDLGAALSQAAALLQPDRAGAVLYVGDAQPTVGELDTPALRERLDRLPAPLRLYGVGIGDEANLNLLSGLCQLSAGQAYRVADRAAAAETALNIVAHLMRPAVSRIKIDAGTGLDQIYPRHNVSLRAGEPLFILARLRDHVPASVQISGMAAGQPFSRSFRLEGHSIDDTADLRLRWSQARLLQLLDSGASSEEVAELGVRQNLITPFTSFYVPSEDEVAQFEAQAPSVRAAGCARSEDAPAAVPAAAPPAPTRPATVAPSAESPPPSGEPRPEPARRYREAEGKMGKKDSSARNYIFAIKGPPADKSESLNAADDDRGVATKEAAAPEAAAALAAPAVQAAQPPPPPPEPAKPMAPAATKTSASHHASRKDKAALGKDDAGTEGWFDRDKSGGRGGGGTGEGTIGLGGLGGSVHGGVFRGPVSASDAKEERRMRRHNKRAANGLDNLSDEQATGTVVAMRDNDVTVLVGILRHRPRGCSAASSQPLEERRDLWRERLSMRPGVRHALEVFQDATRGCELPRWTDRRELLRLMLRSSGGPRGMVELYRQFGDEPEEQSFLRQAILGEVRTARDLRVIFDGLGLGDEERATLAQEVVRSAKSLPDRLRRLQDLLAKWPGDLRLRLLRMETEEAMGQAAAARRTAEEVRRDPYADAQARTAVGELYVRLGDEAAARRAFSEIVEFAPREPLARRRLGDLYRAHGWYDEAYRQYQTLLALQPGDQSVLLLLAMAAAGAGHIEEALGLEQRVIATAEPGGGSGLARVALLSSSLRLAQLRQEARGRNDAETLARLVLRGRQSGTLALARPVRVLLAWAHPEADLELLIAAPGETLGPANDLVPQFGLLGWHSGKEQSPAGPYQIEVRRGEGTAALRYPAELTVITNEGEPSERLWRLPLSISADKPAQRFVLRDQKVEAL